MSDEMTLLKAIRLKPADDTPRLAYADWLDEHCQEGEPGWPTNDEGMSARATFIRAQVQAASLPQGDPERDDWEAKAARLRAAHRDEWQRPLKSDLELRIQRLGWERGMLTSVRMPLDRFIAHGARLFEMMPTLQELDVSHEAVGNDGARALAASPHLKTLSTLVLRGNGIGNDGVRGLANSPYLKNLSTLDLGDNRIDDAGAHALADSPSLANLSTLALWDNPIGNVGAQALANSPNLAKLSVLDLGNTGISAAGAQALAASPHLKTLSTLDLEYNRIGNDGAQALANSPNFRDEMWITVNGFSGEFAEFRQRFGPQRFINTTSGVGRGR